MTEDELIKKHFGLVVSVAKKFVKSYNPELLDEYIQLGRIGLLKAIRNYNEARGAFSTFAWKCIKNEILSHVQREQKHTMTYLDNLDSYVMEESTNGQIWEYVPTLTNREAEVLSLKCAGHSFTEIGPNANLIFHNLVSRIATVNES